MDCGQTLYHSWFCSPDMQQFNLPLVFLKEMILWQLNSAAFRMQSS